MLFNYYINKMVGCGQTKIKKYQNTPVAVRQRNTLPIMHRTRCHWWLELSQVHTGDRSASNTVTSRQAERKQIVTGVQGGVTKLSLRRSYKRDSFAQRY